MYNGSTKHVFAKGRLTVLYWAQLLHSYQPPTQLHGVLAKVYEESYLPLLEVFEKHPHAKVTVNINASLTELLAQHGYWRFIEGLRNLAERGQIEFTGSGKYHPILPLIPHREMERQISQNRKANRYFFGPSYRPQGFFPPEMCYSRDIVEPIASTGHRWIILSGVACPVQWPLDVIHEIASDDDRLAVFFRDDILSNKIAFQTLGPQGFLDHLEKSRRGREDTYIITAMDSETFGHHLRDWETLFLAEVYEELVPRRESYDHIQQTKELAAEHRGLLEAVAVSREVQMVTVSELLDLFPTGQTVEPKASSWSTTDGDIAAGNPYPLWLDKDNEMHRLQWEHTNLCIELVHRAKERANNDETRRYADIARGLLDRALHSDQFWWASRRPMWDVNLIHRGLLQQSEVLVNAYKAINASGASQDEKREYYYRVVVARDLRDKIVDKLFLQ
jgi:alpha-amylase/alpha-mannosidase (GH57 family)